MNTVLLGFRRSLVPVPQFLWQREVAQSSESLRNSLSFMSADHHRVRDFVVLELSRRGEPISLELIAEELDLPPEQVVTLLDELEKHLTFLYRDEQGAVLWAYPLTAEPTPHRIFFSSGEQIYAACAMDAIAAPYVLGKLRGEALDFIVTTKCAHSGRTLHIEIDSELNYAVQEPDANPLLSIPLVNFGQLQESCIIDAF